MEDYFVAILCILCLQTSVLYGSNLLKGNDEDMYGKVVARSFWWRYVWQDRGKVILMRICTVRLWQGHFDEDMYVKVVARSFWWGNVWQAYDKVILMSICMARSWQGHFDEDMYGKVILMRICMARSWQVHFISESYFYRCPIPVSWYNWRDLVQMGNPATVKKSICEAQHTREIDNWWSLKIKYMPWWRIKSPC